MIRCKFRCSEVSRLDVGYERVKFFPVYATDGVNAAWSKATPSGSLELSITVEGAQGKFVPGGEYFLDISPVAPAVPS